MQVNNPSVNNQRKVSFNGNLVELLGSDMSKLQNCFVRFDNATIAAHARREKYDTIFNIEEFIDGVKAVGSRISEKTGKLIVKIVTRAGYKAEFPANELDIVPELPRDISQLTKTYGISPVSINYANSHAPTISIIDMSEAIARELLIQSALTGFKNKGKL